MQEFKEFEVRSWGPGAERRDWLKGEVASHTHTGGEPRTPNATPLSPPQSLRRDRPTRLRDTAG